MLPFHIMYDHTSIGQHASMHVVPESIVTQYSNNFHGNSILHSTCTPGPYHISQKKFPVWKERQRKHGCSVVHFLKTFQKVKQFSLKVTGFCGLESQDCRIPPTMSTGFNVSLGLLLKEVHSFSSSSSLVWVPSKTSQTQCSKAQFGPHLYKRQGVTGEPHWV